MVVGNCLPFWEKLLNSYLKKHTKKVKKIRIPKTISLHLLYLNVKLTAMVGTQATAQRRRRDAG